MANLKLLYDEVFGSHSTIYTWTKNDLLPILSLVASKYLDFEDIIDFFERVGTEDDSNNRRLAWSASTYTNGETAAKKIIDDIFKFTVLMGTFALAMAFAGNDLVNFIGVPLAGLSSYQDYMANANGAAPDQFMMTSLMESAKTTPGFLLAAGAVMIIAMATSKKAQNVIKTSVRCLSDSLLQIPVRIQTP